MKRSTLKATLFALVLIVETVLVASPALAQASRTWVSGVGDDVNPCSRTAPCKTFAGAISKTAAGGEINALDPGGFGAVTITKAITIDGGHAFASSLTSAGNAVNINAGANDKVTLRNLSINGLGTGVDGIKFIAGASLTLEHIRVFGFTGSGVNSFGGGAAKKLFARDVSSYNNGSGMLFSSPASGISRATVGSSNLMHNSTFGLKAESNTLVTVSRSTAANNVNNGFLAITTSASPAVLILDHSVAANNSNGSTAAGVQSNQSAGGSAKVFISNVTASGNDNGLVSAGGGEIISSKNNTVAGNTTADGIPTSTIPQI